MIIKINDEPTTIPDGTTVAQMVFSILQLQSAGMAIAINDTIVPRHSWDSTTLQPDDKMLVIKASQGG